MKRWLIVAASTIALCSGGRIWQDDKELRRHPWDGTKLSAAASVHYDRLFGSIPKFKLGMRLPSVESSITINGVTVDPTLHYIGTSASGSSWPATVGATLSQVGSGTVPTLAFETPLLDDTQAVLFEQGQYFQAAGSSTGDITTEDFVIEAVVRNPVSSAAATTRYEISKINTAGTSLGWAIQAVEDAGGTNDRWVFRVGDGTNTAQEDGMAYNNVAWSYLLAFIDRSEASSNGSRLYTDCLTRVTPGTNMSAVASMTNAKLFSIGNDPDNTAVDKGGSGVAWMRLYKSSGWFAGGATNITQWDAICKERFAKLIGTYADIGTTKVPTTETRATAGSTDKVFANGKRFVFDLEQDWMRFAKRKDLAGTIHRPFVSWGAKTNLVLQSEALNSSWTKINSITVTSNTHLGPSNRVTADGLRASLISNIQGLVQAVTTYGGADNDVFSVWLKKGTRTWAYLEITDGGAQIEAEPMEEFFNLNAGTIGSSGGTPCGSAPCKVASYIEDWGDLNGDGDEWYRCILVFRTGTTGTWEAQFGPAQTDGTKATTGTAGQNTTTAWGALLTDTDEDYPSNYIRNGAASLTHNGDFLQYADPNNIGSDGNAGKGTLAVSMFDFNIDKSSLQNDIHANVSASSDANAVFIGAQDSTDSSNCSVTSNGVQQAQILDGDQSTGTIHTLVCQWQTNLVSFYDGTLKGTDVSSTSPLALDRITIGRDVAGTGQSGFMIKEINVFDEVTFP